MKGNTDLWEHLILISAWNDSGGGFTHRLFDSHPELYCWPFELQLGTASSESSDYPWLKAKFRWPVFPSELMDSGQIFDQILDTELKERLEFPVSSKFRDYELQSSLEEWRQLFCQRLNPQASSGEILRCYLQSFFAADCGYVVTGRERGIVGHCPNVIVDAHRIFSDFPLARILQIVRCPLAGIVDMRRRNPQLTAEEYGTRWNAINVVAGKLQRENPERVRVVSLRDLVSRPGQVMSSLCQWLDLEFSEVLLSATWRGTPISLWGPFGGLRGAGLDYEAECARQVSAADREELLDRTAAARALLNPDLVTEIAAD
jgi:hypothetical protein